MYNEELKTRYLEELSPTSASYVLAKEIFSTAESMERSLGKDVCQFTDVELEELSEKLPMRRHSSFQILERILRDYAKWCSENQLEVSESAAAGKVVNVVIADQKWFASPRDLEKALDRVFEPVSAGTYDTLYRAYFWLAFSGMSIDDVFELKTDDIDFANATITFSDELPNGEPRTRTFPIYRESIPALRDACNANGFVLDNPTYETPVIKPRERGAGYVLRGFSGKSTKKQFSVQVSRRIANSAGVSGVILEFRSVKLSGIFFREYEREIVEPVAESKMFQEVLEEEMQYKTAKREFTNVQFVRERSRSRRNYIADYKVWKKNFYGV